MRKLEYVLKKIEQPLISETGRLVSDRGTKGITLTYDVNVYKSILRIGKKYIYSPFPYKTVRKIYLRPLKETWSAKRERLPKPDWGKKSHPLCGVSFWWSMKSWSGQNTFDEQVKDHELIKCLRAATLTEKEQRKKPFDPKRFYFYQSNQNI